jgi:hypothetical protein
MEDAKFLYAFPLRFFTIPCFRSARIQEGN